MSDHYILNGHDVIKADLMEWAGWLEKADRHVAGTTVGGVRISTVFLGLDHQYGDGPPLLFETMVFAGEPGDDCYCDRYSTWDEAAAGHAKAVQWVRDGMKEPRED